ncbi:DNA-binding transcriptional regulator, MarR family [Terribacillus saccharophilus]|uniref:DNA-binding transcriptional regulator, MarR family n=1 Tax=Terribacillus saccharophilus TaxID=361277 RepID=A0A075LLH2_9BACI|nr:MarR family transcriptional regulator [Terribacillus goriensis]AIF67016.1 MarR family transcriptional regulator [Terribacillus goriensis]SEM47670.1 DNA-binding transcriptional regulator, MarR family [Terribacillus saccharophilus]
MVQDTLTAERIAAIEKELRHIAAIIKQKGREILLQYPITAPQFVALQWLADKGDMTTGDLSQTIRLAISTTTDIVDRLEKNELVKRVRDEKDRRIVRVHILEKGELIISEVIKMRQAYLQELLETFSLEEADQLQLLLHKLHGKMNDYEQLEAKTEKKKRR